MEQGLKYIIMCDGNERTLTKPNINAVFDKYEKEDKYVDWIKGVDGNIIAERLQKPETIRTELKGD